MRIRLAIMALSLSLPLAAQAEPLSDRLTQAQAYGTGTRAETRQAGIVTSFRRVLVKPSGNPALATDPRVDPLDERAAGLVEDLAYIDRISNDPHHNKQGTRDRPFDLVVHFSPSGIARHCSRRPTVSACALVLAPAEGAPPMLDNTVVTLDGTLTWSETDFGWVGRWELSKPNRRWNVAGVSFDEAFRDAMAGTLAALSGHRHAQEK